MRLKYASLGLGLAAGFNLGVVLGPWVRAVGLFATPARPPADEGAQAGTRLIHRYSLPGAAQVALPGTRWEALCASRDETYLFAPEARRPGAVIRTWAVRNEDGPSLSPGEPEALLARLLDGITGELLAEGVEVICAGVTQSGVSDVHARPGPLAAGGERPSPPPRRFGYVRGKIAYRGAGVEGRAFAAAAYEGGTALITVTIVEQPATGGNRAARFASARGVGPVARSACSIAPLPSRRTRT
ncbi:MAG TPA: hypothetical protein VH092_11095 [Urbifossiella sp.]|nr:hypothetical protein [Urbifossiella sp.]